MSARLPGRRTESLFDNRYRYDYIYPRGRSGETLRAYDIQDHDRPVVIKRPAPQDAPPMRAGQEVSIRNERQALERLSGHPVLTELRASGTFRIGSQTHDYIVMDLARGQRVEDLVLEWAKQGEYLPELEVLVIMDRFLDLLAHAHSKQVVYNDADAKHLFWERKTYQLKVIDWGNAVFLDEPGALPSVTRATDIYQCGELLYFILTGGNRLAVEVEDSETFFVSFGTDAERIPARLQAIITRAVHPDPKRRYATITDLRSALAEYRQPLEKTRDEIVMRVKKRVRSTASQEELLELAETLRPALEMDPGYPEAAALAAEIQLYLKQIAIQADLDAIRIYLESSNWPRALSLLHDLLPKADPGSEPLIRFLIGAATTLEPLRLSPPPAGFLEALEALCRGNAPAAGQFLLTTPEARSTARQAQWLLAEQLAAVMPEVILLRPHLIRIRQSLQGVPGADEVLGTLDEIETVLDQPPLPGLTGLQVTYQQAVTLLARLEEESELLLTGESAHDQEALLASVIRAQRAAHHMVEQLDEVGHCVFGDPSRAGDLLHRAILIDPTSPYFEALHDYFDEVHQAVHALGQFKPRSEGANLAAWFASVQEFLQPYLDDLPDRQFHAAAAALRRAAEGWTTVVNYLALGRRQPTINLLRNTAEVIRPYNESLAAWLGTLANRLPDVAQVERQSPNTRLADLLIEGWRAWDRGDGALAAQYGQRAYQQATTDGERLAADRLRRLGDLLNQWLADESPQSVERTDQAETEALGILLAEEENERRTFAEQMPNTTLYLRAMSRGIVAYMQQSSSAGWRALYMHYVLRGMLALLSNQLDEAEFWRDAASKSWDSARTHRAFQVLDRTLTGRRLVQAAEQTLNAVTGPADLDTVRRALNAPLAGEMLAGADHSVQALIQALRDWSDGDFYAAHQALGLSLQHIRRAIEVAGLHIDRFVEWVADLHDAAADLHQARLVIEQGALSASEMPDPAVARAHRQIVTTTLEKLGADYVHQLRQWDDMYEAVLETYTAHQFTRREKLAAFDRHFTSLFITKHPAYPLFRHWREVIERLPPDDLEGETLAIEEAGSAREEASLAYLEDDREAPGRASRPVRVEGGLPWNWIIAGAIIVLLAAAGLAMMRLRDKDDSASSGVRRPVPTEVIRPAGPSVRPTGTQVTSGQAGRTPVAGQTLAVMTPTRPQPSITPSPEPPTVMPTPVSSPTPTSVPTKVEPPTLTPTLFVTNTLIPTNTPQVVAAALADGGDVLAALDAVPPGERPWAQTAFIAGTGGEWLLSTAGSADNTVYIELGPELLSELFQPGAANTLVQVDVVFELVSYHPASLANGAVALGLGAQDVTGQRTVGQVQFIEPNFVTLGMNQNGQFGSRTETILQNSQIALSIRRTDASTLSFFVDNRRLGDSVTLFPQGDPVTLLLFASGQDVTVRISLFQIDFSPRNELP